MPKTVVFAMFDNVQLLDVSGPAAVLAMVNTLMGETVYDLHYVSGNKDRKVITSSQMSINTGSFSDVQCIDMLIVPGALEDAVDQALEDPVLMSWLGSLSNKVEVKISVCMGTFFFAKLGWLDNKKATTHWAGINKLQNDYPRVRVTGESLFQNDGDVWSSGGVTSGIDMMLALITRDFGVEIAIKTAKLLVVYLLRDGRQSQFSIPLEFQTQSNDKNVISLIAWLEERLDKATSVQDMAAYTNVSVRKLHNLCQSMFNFGPAQLLSEMRMEKARMLLLQDERPIKEIAFSLGFSQSAALSKAFNRRYGISPAKYREAYSAPE
ncbi:GlxA family transcriptional regulator [Bacterioplanoides sp.]|uniref:GlxA family transcriptional regulator n=1 Tax=Bacterioplanoides sp. TaxID=2066072 RepID=UPI003B59FD9A